MDRFLRGDHQGLPRMVVEGLGENFGVPEDLGALRAGGKATHLRRDKNV